MSQLFSPVESSPQPRPWQDGEPISIPGGRHRHLSGVHQFQDAVHHRGATADQREPILTRTDHGQFQDRDRLDYIEAVRGHTLLDPDRRLDAEAEVGETALVATVHGGEAPVIVATVVMMIEAEADLAEGEVEGADDVKLIFFIPPSINRGR